MVKKSNQPESDYKSINARVPDAFKESFKRWTLAYGLKPSEIARMAIFAIMTCSHEHRLAISQSCQNWIKAGCPLDDKFNPVLSDRFEVVTERASKD